MDLSKIQKHFQNQIGLKPSVFKDPVWQHLVEERMELNKISSSNEYIEYMEGSKDEQQLIINKITIGETWFYRDIEAFKLLTASIGQLRNGRNPLSILSIGCSTGEEPYSILFSLLDAGLKKEEFSIEALDISSEKIENFDNGIYTSRSFRTKYLLFRDNYFEEKNDEWKIKPHFKGMVDIKCQNALALEKNSYDVIFCRHLMIYFDTEARLKLLEQINQRLKPGGLLFVGHVEMDLFASLGYTKMQHPLAYAMKKEEILEWIQ